MATYIVDSTGSNDAELIGDFTTDAINKTVTFNAGTDGEAKPLKGLETTRQWLIVEVREVGGVQGVIGKHVYSENVADIQTRVEAIRQEMIALHTTFTITATHYKTDNNCDVYRGDEATVVALSANDTNTTFTPPAVWVIDDLDYFAPLASSENVNIITDPGFDNPGNWSIVGGGMSVGNSQLNMVDSNGIATADLNEPVEAGATYLLSVNRLAFPNGQFRFEIGSNLGGWNYASGTGILEQQLVAPTNGANVIFNVISATNLTVDDFTCTKV